MIFHPNLWFCDNLNYYRLLQYQYHKGHKFWLQRKTYRGKLSNKLYVVSIIGRWLKFSRSSSWKPKCIGTLQWVLSFPCRHNLLLKLLQMKRMTVHFTFNILLEVFWDVSLCAKHLWYNIDHNYSRVNFVFHILHRSCDIILRRNNYYYLQLTVITD